MKLRYFCYFLFLAIILNLISWFVGFNLLAVLDLSSALVIIIFPLIFMGIIHGWEDIRSAFSIIGNGKNNKNVLLKAKIFFTNYSKTIFSVALITFVLSFIGIMRNLENREELGQWMWIASLVLLYAGILNMAILPYKAIINKKILELDM